MDKKNYIYGFKAFRKVYQDDSSFKLVCRMKEYHPGINTELCTPEVCRCGIHFCRDILALSSYYSVPSPDVAVFPVIATGETDEEGDKCATTELYIIDQEITYEMLTSIYSHKLKVRFDDDVSISYPPTNEVDAYLLDNHQEDEVVYGGIHLQAKQLPELIKFKDSLNRAESDLVRTYFDITGKPMTFENLINYDIRVVSLDEVSSFMKAVSGGLNRTVLSNMYTKYFGYYKSNSGTWYYIKDLKVNE